MAGNSQAIRRTGRDLEKSRYRFGIGGEHSVLAKEGFDKGTYVAAQRRSSKHGRRFSSATKENFRAWRALESGGRESSRAHLFLQRQEHTFDVLAGSKTIHAMVDAAAGIGPGAEIANLDLIKAPGL